jgi:hypothetical protein
MLDNNKGRTWQFLWWTYPTLGEPRKSVSLLYCVSSVFCFCICFILLLHGPVFLTTGIRAKGNSQEKRVPVSSGRNVGIWKV